MATKGNWTGTAASAEIVPANLNREYLLIQHSDATTVALGIGEDAVAGEGIQLFKIGDTVRLRGPMARKAVYAIGNTGAGTYQEGDVEFFPGTAAT